MNLEKLVAAMVAYGATQVLFKELAPNDNSKNQIYLAGSLDILNVLPMGEVQSEVTRDGAHILKAPVDFRWLSPDGALQPAPHAQLILYPQYPEVRFSGFLRGAAWSPSGIMASRRDGRMLFLGVTGLGQVIGYADESADLLEEVRRLGDLLQTGVFKHLPVGTADTSDARLLARLAQISLLGWIPASKLNADGSVGPCRGTNCGGYTLEAQLGVAPNGRSEPDFEGWEVKSHAVTRFDRLQTGQLTLMTPEPTGGIYKTEGATGFVRKFGYPDSKIEDRLNFSSPHRHGVRNEKTGLTLRLTGYNAATSKITDPHASFALVDDYDVIAAEWHYASLLTHWNRKHAKAVYVPSQCQRSIPIHYRYGDRVRLGVATDFFRFLAAVHSGVVWYDPGIKLEAANSSAPLLKRRSQFRIRSGSLECLYERFEEVALPVEPVD